MAISRFQYRFRNSQMQANCRNGFSYPSSGRSLCATAIPLGLARADAIGLRLGREVFGRQRSLDRLRREPSCGQPARRPRARAPAGRQADSSLALRL
jgi:hypothetical protein